MACEVNFEQPMHEFMMTRSNSCFINKHVFLSLFYRNFFCKQNIPIILWKACFHRWKWDSYL